MGAERGQQHAVEVGRDDGAARGERVGGRSRGGGDDDPIGGKDAEEAVVEAHLDVEQARDGVLAQDEVVERVKRVEGSPVPIEDAVKETPLKDVVAAVQDVLQVLLRAVGLSRGEEAQMPQVDAVEERSRVQDIACGAQKRSVPADHDGDLDRPEPLLVGESRCRQHGGLRMRQKEE